MTDLIFFNQSSRLTLFNFPCSVFSWPHSSPLLKKNLIDVLHPAQDIIFMVWQFRPRNVIPECNCYDTFNPKLVWTLGYIHLSFRVKLNCCQRDNRTERQKHCLSLDLNECFGLFALLLMRSVLIVEICMRISVGTFVNERHVSDEAFSRSVDFDTHTLWPNVKSIAHSTIFRWFLNRN